jgi:hypothetical protein
MRNWRSDLNDASDVRHFAHGGNDATCHRPFELQRITNDENRLAFIRQRDGQFRRTRSIACHVNAHQREIAVVVDIQDPCNSVQPSFAVQRPYVNAGSAANYVQVRHNLARSQKETAAGHEWLAIGVIGHYRDDRWLYTFDEFREIFLRRRDGRHRQNEKKGKKGRDVYFSHVVKPWGNKEIRALGSATPTAGGSRNQVLNLKLEETELRRDATSCLATQDRSLSQENNSVLLLCEIKHDSIS